LAKKFLNRETISYLICGGLTTVLGVVAFELFGFLGTVMANTAATVIAVIFAFIVNKVFVFRSRRWEMGFLVAELLKFSGARLITFLGETALLKVLIDWVGVRGLYAKIFTAGLVIVGNYLFSKWLVFRKL